MKSNSLHDTHFNVKVFVAPQPTPLIGTQIRQAKAAPAFCTVCGSGLLLLEKAARLCQHGPRLLYRWVEQGRLHFRELADGSVMVCGRTLVEQISELEAAAYKKVLVWNVPPGCESTHQDATTEELPQWLASPQIYTTIGDQ